MWGVCKRAHPCVWCVRARACESVCVFVRLQVLHMHIYIYRSNGLKACCVRPKRNTTTRSAVPPQNTRARTHPHPHTHYCIPNAHLARRFYGKSYNLNPKPKSLNPATGWSGVEESGRKSRGGGQGWAGVVATHKEACVHNKANTNTWAHP